MKGETTVTLDAYVGVKNSYKALNMMNSDQYYNFIMKAYENDASFQNSMKDKFTNQYQKGYNTNWWNEVTRTAFNQNYNLSIRKGTDNSRSSLSLGYVDDQVQSSLLNSRDFHLKRILNMISTNLSLLAPMSIWQR